MSTTPEAILEEVAPARSGGKRNKILIFGAGLLLLAGAGAGAAVYAGLFGHDTHAEAAEDTDLPKLVLKSGEEEAPPKGGVTAPDALKYKASYYTLEQNFMSNLRDSDAFAQVTLGVSTFYDSRVIDNLKANEMPVRSAALLILADQDVFEIATPQGKKRLQQELKVAINDVLKQKTGFGGIDDVYFTSFIIQ